MTVGAKVGNMVGVMVGENVGAILGDDVDTLAAVEGCKLGAYVGLCDGD